MLVCCNTCNEQVSKNAYDCPKCGAVLRKPKRSIFGKICLFLFYGFNLAMLMWLVSAFGIGVDAETGAEKAGAAIGMGLIMIVWVLGGIITGLLSLMTRASR